MKAAEAEKCIDCFGRDIYRFCLKLCMNKTEAEDLYQQTFLKALESIQILDWEQNPRALFFSLSYNLWKSEIRKNARRSSIVPCGNLEEEDKERLPSRENVEESFFQKELQEEIKKIVESLPDKIRIPLTLHYFFDFSVEQVAETIKKPPGTVKSRLYKGRSLIKKRLEEVFYGKQKL